MIDLKELYRYKVDELVAERYGEKIDFHNLSEGERWEIYYKAVEIVDTRMYSQEDWRENK